MNESAFKRRVVALALQYGWEWMHVRPARTNRPGVWKTPTDGTLGAGWPDLILVRGRRIIAAELKAEDGVVSAEQSRVLEHLSDAGVETHIWRPSLWEWVVTALGPEEES
jgi:hypothetical protein